MERIVFDHTDVVVEIQDADHWYQVSVSPGRCQFLIIGLNARFPNIAKPGKDYVGTVSTLEDLGKFLDIVKKHHTELLAGILAVEEVANKAGQDANKRRDERAAALEALLAEKGLLVEGYV